MKNKIKLLSLILATSILLVACGGNNGESVDETNNETMTEGESQAETKEEKPVSIENLRTKKTPFLSVGGKEVSYEDYYKFYDLYAGIIAMQQQLNSNVANLVIRDTVITKDLEEKNIEISKEEIDAEIQNYVQSLGGENEFIKYLNMLGISKELFEENIKNSLKDVKHKEIFVAEQEVSDQEISEYYEANKQSIDNVIAKHILVEDEELAKEISQKLKDGEDFKALSDEYSIDEAAKMQGGELGLVNENGYDKDFVEAAFKLADNEVSDPVKTQHGYHIIVVSKNNVGKDKNMEEIKNNLANEKYEKAMSEKIEESGVKFYDYDGEEIK